MNVIPNSPEARDIANVLHPYTNLNAHTETGPHIIEQGKGIYVRDNQGREFIEGLAGLWCTSFGFGEEELIEAAVKQMRQLPYYHAFASKSMNPAIDLAERLKAIAPGEFSKVYFACSGSEANDTVVKLLWYYNNAVGRPEKKKIISRLKGYHGVTVAAGSLTGLPYAQADFDLPIPGILHTETPYYYRDAEEGESEEDFATRLAESLENMILEEGPETVAGFIAEPVMGAGGVLIPPKTYFEKIKAVLTKYDIFMIADEVICGFGRTGNMWGSQTFNVQPDILTCAKALSSAYLPISAVMIPEIMFEAFQKNSEKLGVFGHGHTYSGHPACAAVAVRNLELMEERNVLAHVQSVSPRFIERIMGFQDHPLAGDCRAVGLIGAIEIVKDKNTKQSFDPSVGISARIPALAAEQGLIVRALPGDSVGFCPPLIIDKQQIDDMFDRFQKAIDQLADDLTREGLL